MVNGNAEMIGNFFVSHPLYKTDDNFFLAFAEVIRIVGVLVNHIRYFHRNIILFGFCFKSTDGGNEDFVFHLSVMKQPLFVVVDVVEYSCELVVM